MKFRHLAIALSVTLSACTFHAAPYIGYDDASQKLANTTVLSAWVQGRTDGSFGQITSIDGKSTSCWQVGCPAWVRVLPGDHVFGVRYTVGTRQGETRMTVPNMQARHVYQIDFVDQGTTFRATFRDLGENPEYGMTLGLKGVNQQYHPVKFD